MRLAVSPELAESIRSLDAQGWSQRKIANYHNLSTTTVFRILHGQWHPVDEREDPLWELKLRAERCSGCGGLVYDWPCRVCEVRALCARRSLRLAKAA